MIRLLELRVGQPQQLGDPHASDPLKKPWRSAIYKELVMGPAWLTTEGLAGDAVADKKHHGGPDQAILAYGASQYARWKADGVDAEPGAFGENLLIDEITDQDVCVGDIFDLGDVRIQVSQPRVPCGTLARRFGRGDIVKRVWETARGGWYLRVLREGYVEVGRTLALADRPHPEWTIQRALHARWRMDVNPSEALALAALPALSTHWRATLQEAAAR
jgi:MOSC domain-containing protein YiiM